MEVGPDLIIKALVIIGIFGTFIYRIYQTRIQSNEIIIKVPKTFKGTITIKDLNSKGKKIIELDRETTDGS